MLSIPIVRRGIGEAIAIVGAAALSITFNIWYYWWTKLVEVVSVTKKGQATIPKRLRQKYGIKDKVIVEENECGIVLKPLPSPSDDLGSLKAAFKGKTAKQLLAEARKEETAKDRVREKRVGAADVRL